MGCVGESCHGALHQPVCRSAEPRKWNVPHHGDPVLSIEHRALSYNDEHRAISMRQLVFFQHNPLKTLSEVTMNHKFLFLVALALGLIQSVQSQVPTIISYQGVLTDS